MSEQSFQLHYKTITIYGDWEKPVPVVYFHSFQKEGQQVWDECRRLSVPQFYLIEISGHLLVFLLTGLFIIHRFLIRLFLAQLPFGTQISWNM